MKSQGKKPRDILQLNLWRAFGWLVNLVIKRRAVILFLALRGKKKKSNYSSKILWWYILLLFIKTIKNVKSIAILTSCFCILLLQFKKNELLNAFWFKDTRLRDGFICRGMLYVSKQCLKMCHCFAVDSIRIRFNLQWVLQMYYY